MRLAARLTGVGHYVPERVLTNHDLERLVETSDAWIVERTGIRERRIAAAGETASTLGTEAARRALWSAERDAADIDLVIAGTCSPDGMFPAVATRIQDAIGAPHAGAFDVNAACTGFVSALGTAAQYIATGQARRVLVVGTEVLSRITDWQDRGTCVLFGDGAGAVVLEAPEEDAAADAGAVESFLLRSDGSLAGLLYADGPGCWAGGPGTAAASLAHEARIVMDGRGVFRQAVTLLAQASAEAIAAAGLDVADVDLCVPHQANVRIIAAVAKQLGLSPERTYVNIERYGNTSSASIPIALSEATAAGRFKPGDHVLLAAFGGGLSWGAMVLEWAGVRRIPAPAGIAPALEATVRG